jgi:hypothetical protein
MLICGATNEGNNVRGSTRGIWAHIPWAAAADPFPQARKKPIKLEIREVALVGSPLTYLNAVLEAATPACGTATHRHRAPGHLTSNSPTGLS